VIEVGPCDGEMEGAGRAGGRLDLGGGIGDHEPELVVFETLSSEGGEQPREIRLPAIDRDNDGNRGSG